MQEYFDKDTCEKLYQNLKTWDKTPYFHMGQLKKRGVDCTKFVGLVLVEIGVLTQLEPRVYYSKDWPMHSEIEVVFESIENHFGNYAADGLSYKILDSGQEIKFGDLLCFSITRSGLSNHTSLATKNGMMYHCSQNVGVVESQILPHWKRRLTRIYRLYKES